MIDFPSCQRCHRPTATDRIHSHVGRWLCDACLQWAPLSGPNLEARVAEHVARYREVPIKAQGA